MKKTNPLKIVEIENIANNVRREFGVTLDSPFPILEVLDKLHFNGLLTIQYLEDDDPIFEEDTPAKYNPSDNFIYVKISVLEEIENDEYRAYFTLAHELFHYIQCEVLGFNFEEVEECPCYVDAEWQANEFAGQILIPTKYVSEEEYNALDIVERFKVSETCAVTRRLKYLNRQKRKKVKLSK